MSGAKIASNLTLDLARASPMMRKQMKRDSNGSNSTLPSLDKDTAETIDSDTANTEMLESSMSGLLKLFCGVCHNEEAIDEAADDWIAMQHQLYLNPNTIKALEENDMLPFIVPSSRSSSASTTTTTGSKKTAKLPSADVSGDVIISKHRVTKKQHHHPQDFLTGPQSEIKETKPSFGEEFGGTYAHYRIHTKYAPNFCKSFLKSSSNSSSLIPPFFIKQNKSHVYSEPMASTFNVRGPTYLTDGGVKVPSASSLFALLSVHSILRPKSRHPSQSLHISKHSHSFLHSFQAACKKHNIIPPFLLVFNLVVPWGNLCAYMYRPNAAGSTPYPSPPNDQNPAEKLWKTFLQSNTAQRNDRLKLIPRIIHGPWLVRKAVGSSPAIIGQKLPVEYYGGIDSNYLEICLDVTRGSQLANSIANTVASKSDIITVDLCFVIEGKEERYLPECVLGAFRLHHVSLKKNKK